MGCFILSSSRKIREWESQHFMRFRCGYYKNIFFVSDGCSEYGGKFTGKYSWHQVFPGKCMRPEVFCKKAVFIIFRKFSVQYMSLLFSCEFCEIVKCTLCVGKCTLCPGNYCSEHVWINRSSLPKAFCKKGVLKNFAKLKNWQENTSGRVYFLIKLQAEACNFIK